MHTLAPCSKLGYPMQRGDTVFFYYQPGGGKQAVVDITVALRFALFSDIPAEQRPRGRYRDDDWCGLFRSFEALGKEGRRIGHSSVFGVEDAVDLGRFPRLRGCTLLLLLPEEAAEWKAVEEVGGVSRVVNRWEQAGGRMDVTGMPFSGVYLGHIEQGAKTVPAAVAASIAAGAWWVVPSQFRCY